MKTFKHMLKIFLFTFTVTFIVTTVTLGTDGAALVTTLTRSSVAVSVHAEEELSYKQFIENSTAYNQSADYEGEVSLGAVLSSDKYGSQEDCYVLERDGQIDYIFYVEEEGMYNIGVDFYPSSHSLSAIDIAVMVNGMYQFTEAESIRLQTQWANQGEPSLNRYGDEVVPSQELIIRWYSQKLIDNNGDENYPYKFYLKKGENIVSIINLRTDIVISNVKLTGIEKTPTYEEYLNQFDSNTKVINSIDTHEAEQTLSKNKVSIIAETSFDANVTPYNTNYLKVNQIGYESFHNAGDEVRWEIEVKETGFYYITFKVKQSDGELVNSAVFRTIRIDDKIPFKEMESYKFPYITKWINSTLKDENNNYYKFYLTEGVHTLSMTIDNTVYCNAISELNQISEEITELAIQIKKMTGNVADRNRDWDMTEYFVDLPQQMQDWQDTIYRNYEYIRSLSDKETKASVMLKEAHQMLKNLAKKPNDLPNQLSALSDGGSSVLYMIASSSQYVAYQPYAMDKLYIHGDVTLDAPEVNGFIKARESIARFFNTFKGNQYEQVSKVDDEITVWINASRSYANTLQQIIDTEYTPKSGIKVTLSIMPTEDKVILSCASNTNPDLVLGLSTGMPYELGVRNAAVDLASLEGFNEVMKDYSPGAFISYVVDDSIYALPEKQDFWVLIYRKDILERLNLEIPDTWDDVIKMLPALQRYGMNFVPNLSTFTAYKPFGGTLPFIMQHGGDVVHNDGLTTAITDETSLKGIKLMTDIFTMYSMPTQVSSFYNSFKLGELPIGIANLGTYQQLSFAADELAGKWAIAPLVGVKSEDGEVLRYAPGSATCSLIFENSDKTQEAWEFLKWYMSTETQVKYANALYAKFGGAHILNTANIDAFDKIEILPEDDKKVILDQWEWLVETPKIPGHYMIERQLSNVWNKVVFNGMNVREAVDDASIIINHEITRKMKDYKYIIDDELVKQYKVPTLEMLESWGKNE